MANSWKNRVKFIVRWEFECKPVINYELESPPLVCFVRSIVWKGYNRIYSRYMYDYDGNGVLDKNDFEVQTRRQKHKIIGKHIYDIIHIQWFLNTNQIHFPVPGSEKHNHGRKGNMEPGKVSQCWNIDQIYFLYWEYMSYILSKYIQNFEQLYISNIEQLCSITITEGKSMLNQENFFPL